MINDVSGLRDPTLASLVAERGIGVILMASQKTPSVASRRRGHGRGRRTRSGKRRRKTRARMEPSRRGRARTRAAWSSRPRTVPPPPRAATRGRRTGDCRNALLKAALKRARAAGIPEERVVLDPGIGFFRNEAMAWRRVGCASAGGAGHARGDRAPTVRRRFEKILHWRDHRPGRHRERLAGSLAATAVAVCNGAALIRTHDVAETLDAVRVARTRPPGIRRPIMDGVRSAVANPPTIR